MKTIHRYLRAGSLEEAYELNQNRKNQIIAGMLWLRTGNGTIETAIDLCDLGLDRFIEEETQFSIGAMVSLRTLETHPGFHAYTQGAAAKALGHIIGVQFRNLATVGGSLWGRFGFSDVLPLFLAMDSYVELYKGGIVPLEQFVSMKPDRDILVRVLVKKKPLSIAYQSVRGQQTDFPLLTCAVSLLDGEGRAVIGARPGRAVVVEDTEHRLAQGRGAEFAALVAETVPTGSNNRGSAAYRTRLAEVLTARCAEELGGMT